MIDIRRSSKTSLPDSNARSVFLLVVLCFVVWDSGYLSTLLSRYNRDEVNSEVQCALLIKCDGMSDEQKYTASSPVLDELADRCQVSLRVVSREPGDVSDSPIWIQELLRDYASESPCLALRYFDGRSEVYPAPKSVSEFRGRIGAQ